MGKRKSVFDNDQAYLLIIYIIVYRPKMMNVVIDTRN